MNCRSATTDQERHGGKGLKQKLFQTESALKNINQSSITNVTLSI
jgi:hypothetical protein